MFPPNGGRPGGGAPPRGLRQIRRDVGTTPPEAAPDAAPQSQAVVSMSCPNCGTQIDKTFNASPDDVAPEPATDGGQPLPTVGGGPNQ